MNTLVIADDLRLARSGDVAAFERLVVTTQQLVTGFALTRLRDQRSSETVAASVYVDAWRALPELDEDADLLARLRQQAHSAASTFGQAQPRDRRRPSAIPAESPLSRAVLEEERRILGEAIDDTPEELRDVLVVYFRESRATPRTAELFGWSEEELRARLRRAHALRPDVLARLEQAARRSSPSRAFSVAVAAEIASAQPARTRPRGFAFALGLLGLSQLSQ